LRKGRLELLPDLLIAETEIARVRRDVLRKINETSPTKLTAVDESRHFDYRRIRHARISDVGQVEARQGALQKQRGTNDALIPDGPELVPFLRR
jgi:hypothetical protein